MFCYTLLAKELEDQFFEIKFSPRFLKALDISLRVK